MMLRVNIYCEGAKFGLEGRRCCDANRRLNIHDTFEGTERELLTQAEWFRTEESLDPGDYAARVADTLEEAVAAALA